jgi:uncharacterized protein (DUF885 family)
MKRIMPPLASSAWLIIAPLAALGAGPGPAQAQALRTPASPALARVISDYEAWVAQEDPSVAGDSGDQAALFRLPDASLRADDAHRTMLLEFQRRLLTLKNTRLNGDDNLNRDLLLRGVNDQLESLAFDEARMPFTAYWSFSSFGDGLGRSTIIQSKLEADAYLSRLRALPAYYDVQIQNARRGLSTGFVQPRLVVEVALRTARKQADQAPETSPMLAPLQHLPASIPAEVQAQLKAEGLRVLKEEVLPAHRRIVAFLNDDYLPRARTYLAARDLPDGERYYASLVRRFTTTDLTPDQVHQLGLDEVKRIRGEMDKVIARTGFKGSFAEFVHFLRTDPQFYPKSRDELYDRYRVIAKRIDGELPRLFGKLPRLTYGVKPIPSETEEGQTTAYYEGGNPTRGVAGTFAVNLSHLDQRPLFEAPTLTLHEAVPGHHLQIALAQELEGQPRFRSRLDFTAFVEGWALYSEQLGQEIGLYSSPYEEFGQLSYEMWRACRLVADTGIHWKRWTRDQARACFIENSALAEHNIDVEVDRYISWPGQALGYKVGELRIMALRRRAEASLGDKFSLRDFHDAVLAGGALPLDVLESRIDGWIRQRLAASRAPKGTVTPGAQ